MSSIQCMPCSTSQSAPPLGIYARCSLCRGWKLQNEAAAEDKHGIRRVGSCGVERWGWGLGSELFGVLRRLYFG